MVVKIPWACCFCIGDGVSGFRPSHVPKRLTGGGNPDGAHIVIAWVGCIGPGLRTSSSSEAETNQLATEITTQEVLPMYKFHSGQINYSKRNSAW